MAIQNNNIRLFVPTFAIEECLNEIRICLENGWTGSGFKTEEIELLWNEYYKWSYSIFLNSNTSGLELALQAMKEEYNWDDESEIITTPLTFVSTNHAILRNNLKPVFSDVDESLCIDPDRLISNITEKTVCLMYVGFGGNTGQLMKISRICQERNIKLILDAAHMAGTRYLDKEVALEDLVDIAVFSFQAVKNLPTADSGMLSTNNQKLYEIVKNLSWLGISTSTFERTSNFNYKWKYDVERVGMKANGNSIMAAIAKVQLLYLEQDNRYRRELARHYKLNLEGISNIKFVNFYEDIVSSQHLFQVRIQDRRDELVEYLAQNGIATGVHYTVNTVYPMYQFAKGLCEKAEKYSEELLSLPLHLQLTIDDVTFISDKIKEFIN